MINLSIPFNATYDVEPSSSDASTSSEVPDLYDVAIAGHPYMLDLASNQFRHETIPVLRPVFIQADTLGEKNINPESLWRASQNTWHKGAGQVHLDRPESDPARFRSCKGIDIWSRWQISLLPDTSQARASANSNLKLAVAGARLYVADGNTLAYTTDLSAFTTVTATPAAAVNAVASDGFTVYAAYANNGLWTTTTAGSTATQLVTGTTNITAVAYVRGRLMLAVGRSLYNQTSTTPGAIGTALFDHPNTQFTWVGFAESPGFIYAAGYSGDKTLIYRIGIQPDGTALTTPVQAGQLPDGEIIRSISSYLGFILIGTDTGVRLAQPAANGDLDIGALVTTGPCYAFEGQDRFVWFGWNNYDSVSTGLGRLDLNLFNDTAPAYASDLMVTGQGQVLDVATFGGKRVLAVAGLGFYVESTSRVLSGSLDSGLITYDLPEDKIGYYLDVKNADPLAGSLSASLSVDATAFVLIGTRNTLSTVRPFTVGELRGETFEIRVALSRDTDPTLGPVVTRLSLQANPAVDTGILISVPLLLTETVTRHNGSTDPVDVDAEYAYLRGLRASGASVTYQEAATGYPVTVQDITRVPTHLTASNKAWNSTTIVKLKTV